MAFYDVAGRLVDLESESQAPFLDEDGLLNKTFYDQDGEPIAKDIF
jgi:hypothetical protein